MQGWPVGPLPMRAKDRKLVTSTMPYRFQYRSTCSVPATLATSALRGFASITPRDGF